MPADLHAAADGQVAWYPGDGNAFDIQGGNNGIAEGGLAYVTGKVAQAFSFNGTDADVRIPEASSLNVGASNGLTIDAWINPADVSSQQPLVEWNDGSSYGPHLWLSVTSFGGAAGNLFANLVDTGGVNHVIQSAGGVITANTYQHVAVTYNKSTGDAALYLNGTPVAQQNLGIFTPKTASDVYLGYRPGGSGAGTRYQGALDEVEIFNRALSPAEISNIYNADSAGKCKQPQSLTVTNVSDGSEESLRNAIEGANNYGGRTNISFNIPGSGVQTISLSSALPTITSPVTIDGTTQPGYNGVPLIELNGAGAGTGADALRIIAGNSIVRGLVINRFNGNGIVLQTGGNSIVQGNYIGTNSSGTAGAGNFGSGLEIYDSSGNTIGGTNAAARNVISANGQDGIEIATGGQSGISNRNIIQGNYIGTNAAGADNVATLGNITGVSITNGNNNVVGDSVASIGTAGAGNIIAFNAATQTGVHIFSGTGNAVLSNSIFANGGLGIDLNSDFSVTANDTGDGDTGANNLQNFPILTSATSGGGGTIINGTLNSTPNTQFVIQFFSNPSCDASGNGEGKVYLGSITTNQTDGNGDTSFNAQLGTIVNAGEVVTATATDTNGNTSEFSACRSVTTGGGGSTVTLSGRVVDGQGAGVSGVTVTLFTTQQQPQTTTTDSNGNYSFSNINGGAFVTLEPSQAGYSFSPSQQSFIVYTNTTAQDFIRTPTHSISGRITDASGAGISGVTVNVFSGGSSNGSPNGTSASPVVTDGNGNYSFTNLPSGSVYTIEPSKAGYYFTPTFLTYQDFNSDITNANFTGTRTASSPGKIAFIEEVDGPTFIALVNSDGSNRVAVSNTDGAASSNWSPDGTKLVFSRSVNSPGVSGIYTINADGTNPVQLTTDPTDAEPAWSLDGTRIAFIRLGAGTNDIYIFI